MGVHVERALVSKFAGDNTVSPRLGKVLAEFQECDRLHGVAGEVERGERCAAYCLVFPGDLFCCRVAVFFESVGAPGACDGERLVVKFPPCWEETVKMVGDSLVESVLSVPTARDSTRHEKVDVFG